MFGTLKNTRSINKNGVGLGLFICKQIVEQFDGEIMVTSEQGLGTSFYFSFLLDSMQVSRNANRPQNVDLNADWNLELTSQEESPIMEPDVMRTMKSHLLESLEDNGQRSKSN